MFARLFKPNALRGIAIAALFLSFVFAASPAFAHRVVIFAWIEGDTVFTESQFPDGRKIADAQIKVFDMNNSLLLDGKTGANGEFSFKVPKITPLHIVLEAGMGHQGEWKISEEEIVRAMGPGPDNAATGPDPTDPAPPAAAPPVTESAKDPSQTPDSGVFLTEHQLEKVIDAALDRKLDEKLDKKLQPILRSLAHIQEPGPTVHDIMGGIGYIFGLMGVAAYFLSRKKDK